MTNNTPPASGFQLGNKFYDRAKFLVQVFLPALGLLYATIAQIFSFPGTQQVLGVLAAIGLFLGTIMRISSTNFDPPTVTGTPVGNFVITEHPDGMKTVTLGDLNRDPADFIDDDVISFRKVTEKAPPEPAEDDRGENIP